MSQRQLDWNSKSLDVLLPFLSFFFFSLLNPILRKTKEDWVLIPSFILRGRLAAIQWICLPTKDAELADQWSESTSLFARETFISEICNLDLLERQLWKSSVSHVITFPFNLKKKLTYTWKIKPEQVVVEAFASYCPNNFTSSLHNPGILQPFPHLQDVFKMCWRSLDLSLGSPAVFLGVSIPCVPHFQPWSQLMQRIKPLSVWDRNRHSSEWSHQRNLVGEERFFFSHLALQS